ncbi:MAG: bifunctional phosphoribosyl-AMP cyclohydrolase/phosphoribosyl-ATP diphosphatase HisIE [Bacteroidaceae bacterium]|nr:bifunctional phosphoribosyl-AMP cyclohydrolase/phosphoribosyl-ATP diphosphatase HisIE [Bacteroidaceae bacterium]
MNSELNIDFNKCGGLVPAIIQDAKTKTVLMLGYMNQEALRKTQETGLVTFFSRSRQCLWTKGETSGNYLHLVDIKSDCDNDTLLVQAIPDGPTCHTGTDTCWGEENRPNPLLFLSELSDFIEQRHREMPEGSYTTSLFRDGLNRMAQKVGEEALELVIEATNGTNDRLIYEGSDMLYHLIVLLTSKGLRIEDMAAELMERHNPGWKKH